MRSAASPSTVGSCDGGSSCKSGDSYACCTSSMICSGSRPTCDTASTALSRAARSIDGAAAMRASTACCNRCAACSRASLRDLSYASASLVHPCELGAADRSAPSSRAFVSCSPIARHHSSSRSSAVSPASCPVASRRLISAPCAMPSNAAGSMSCNQPPSSDNSTALTKRSASTPCRWAKAPAAAATRWMAGATSRLHSSRCSLRSSGCRVPAPLRPYSGAPSYDSPGRTRPPPSTRAPSRGAAPCAGVKHEAGLGVPAVLAAACSADAPPHATLRAVPCDCAASPPPPLRKTSALR